MEEYDATEIKRAVNELLWMYLPNETTLKEAEKIAVQVYRLISMTWDKRTSGVEGGE